MSDVCGNDTGILKAGFEGNVADAELLDDSVDPAAWTGVVFVSLVSLPLWFAIGTTAVILL